MGPPMTPSVSARREWRTTLVLVAVGSTISFARADMVVTDSMQPWETCAECHSLDGISVMARFPKLAGQRSDYIAKQVRDFRDGRRRNDGGQMATIAAEIDGEGLAKSAAYFAALPAPPPDASLTAESEEWRRGAALYRRGDAASSFFKNRPEHKTTAAAPSVICEQSLIFSGGAMRGLSSDAAHAPASVSALSRICASGFSRACAWFFTATFARCSSVRPYRCM